MAEELKTIPTNANSPDATNAVAPKVPSAAAPQIAKVARKRTSKKAASKAIVVKSKRKRAIARGYVNKGSGIIRINSMDISTIYPMEHRMLILEPITVSDATMSIGKSIDIKINIQGGGSSAQAQAARGVVARAIAKYSGDENIAKAYLQYDRTMMVDDFRRVEPKKFLGPKARSRFQKSYR